MHPFHPLAGQEFELVGYAHTWGEHRVFFRRPGEGRVRTLPAGWTDVVAVDPWVLLAAGRSFTRVEDLLSLAALIAEMAEGVNEIPPDCRAHYAGVALRAREQPHHQDASLDHEANVMRRQGPQMAVDSVPKRRHNVPNA